MPFRPHAKPPGHLRDPLKDTLPPNHRKAPDLPFPARKLSLGRQDRVTVDEVNEKSAQDETEDKKIWDWLFEEGCQKEVRKAILVMA